MLQILKLYIGVLRKWEVFPKQRSTDRNLTK